MKNEFDNLKVSAAGKLKLICTSFGIQGKYMGRKTDTQNTIRIFVKIFIFITILPITDFE